MSTENYNSVAALWWQDDGLSLLDQRMLPQKSENLLCKDVTAVARAIQDMVVRGAPAIGIAAAYGVVLAARDRYAASPEGWKQDIEKDLELLAASRPTAVNLFWAIAKMRAVIETLDGEPAESLLREAARIHNEDIEANRRMGTLGAALIEERCAVLTHCNAGALATGGYGTALGVIRSAYAAGKVSQVYADETRPWLQGARLTAWELLQDGIPVTLVAEGAAAHLMKQGEVKWVIVGSDRIAANGDVANKIGTYNLAITARYHGARLMVVAPTSTIDMDISCGDNIPIETRSEDELLLHAGLRVAAAGASAWNPVFDVTPAELVDAIVTERGVVLAPTAQKMAKLMLSES